MPPSSLQITSKPKAMPHGAMTWGTTKRESGYSPFLQDDGAWLPDHYVPDLRPSRSRKSWTSSRQDVNYERYFNQKNDVVLTPAKICKDLEAQSHKKTTNQYVFPQNESHCEI